MDKQVGGHLLGQGVYGCTFDPAPRCAGGKVFKRVGDLPAVGKVTVEKTGEELAVGRAIMALPLAGNYFALPTESCRPEATLRDPEASNCRVMEEEGRSAKYTMLVMPAAGQQLLRWAENLDVLAASYIAMFAHLLEGIIIYQEAGFVHNDIHMGNVLVDERGVGRFIDFGLAFKPAEIQEWEDSHLGTRFRPKYMWQAPEVHAWRMRLNGMPVMAGCAQLLAANHELQRIENQFLTRKRAVEALGEFLESTNPDDGVGFLRQYAKGFDCWRIGLMFWLLWDDLLAWSGFQQTALWERRDLVRQVLCGLTDFDPRVRWSAAQALAALDPNNRLATAHMSVPSASARVAARTASGKSYRLSTRRAPVPAEVRIVQE